MSENYEAPRFSKNADNDNVEKVTLFYVDDVAYQIPKRPSTRIALKYLDETATGNEVLAQRNMIVSLMGQEAWEALLTVEDASMDDFNKIIEVASKIVFGDLAQNGPKG